MLGASVLPGARARRPSRQATKKEPPWTDAELELLESLAHHSVEVIRRKMAAKGFRRSATAIAVKVKREVAKKQAA